MNSTQNLKTQTAIEIWYMTKIFITLGIVIVLIFAASIFWFIVIYDTERDFVAAAAAGDIDQLKILLSKKDISIDGRALDDWTALTIASSKGYNDVVEFLLKSGANVNAVSGGGKTALFWARYQSVFLKIGSRKP